ncbi:MAG TPA: agmatinase [Candidatus Dormibacteraeota bacterium]|nr:agmatinase [Candidatus Dormibacteraeota bacterium]
MAEEVVGQVDGLSVPRYAGLATFARLPQLGQVPDYAVAVLGIPFDAGTTYRPGARFGPSHIREASRLLKPFHPYQESSPFAVQQVVDAGDVACNPFDISTAISEIETAARRLLEGSRRVVALGGDHTVALPMLRAVAREVGPVALVHFDAHLDTWNTYFGAPYTHGTPFRRAAEEGLLAEDRSIHVGIRGSLYAPTDLSDDAGLGFRIIHASDFDTFGTGAVIARIRERVGDSPVYISADIDVLDPAHAPGTGTPSAGGLTSRELLACIRGLRGLPIASADLVEVAPAYDSAQLTGVAAAEVVYEFLTLMGLDGGRTNRGAAVEKTADELSTKQGEHSHEH